MELTQLRNELLRQHTELRGLAKVVAAASERARTDAVALSELRTLLENLYDEVRAHNAYEDKELHAILPKIDAWGAIRDQLMDTRHSEEHGAIMHAIEAAAAAPSASAVADGTLAVLRELEAHMDREERECLAADVLRDDLITSGVGG